MASRRRGSSPTASSAQDAKVFYHKVDLEAPRDREARKVDPSPTAPRRRKRRTPSTKRKSRKALDDDDVLIKCCLGTCTAMQTCSCLPGCVRAMCRVLCWPCRLGCWLLSLPFSAVRGLLTTCFGSRLENCNVGSWSQCLLIVAALQAVLTLALIYTIPPVSMDGEPHFHLASGFTPHTLDRNGDGLVTQDEVIREAQELQELATHAKRKDKGVALGLSKLFAEGLDANGDHFISHMELMEFARRQHLQPEDLERVLDIPAQPAETMEERTKAIAKTVWDKVNAAATDAMEHASGLVDAGKDASEGAGAWGNAMWRWAMGPPKNADGKASAEDPNAEPGALQIFRDALDTVMGVSEPAATPDAPAQAAEAAAADTLAGSEQALSSQGEAPPAGADPADDPEAFPEAMLESAQAPPGDGHAPPEPAGPVPPEPAGLAPPERADGVPLEPQDGPGAHFEPGTPPGPGPTEPDAPPPGLSTDLPPEPAGDAPGPLIVPGQPARDPLAVGQVGTQPLTLMQQPPPQLPIPITPMAGGALPQMPEVEVERETLGDPGGGLQPYDIRYNQHEMDNALKVRLVSHLSNRLRQLLGAFYVTSHVMNRPLHVVWRLDKFCNTQFLDLFMPLPGDITFAAKGMAMIDPPYRGSFTKVVNQYLSHDPSVDVGGWYLDKATQSWTPPETLSWSKVSDSMYGMLKPSALLGREVDRIVSAEALDEVAISILLASEECNMEPGNMVTTTDEEMFSWIDKVSAKLKEYWQTAGEDKDEVKIFISTDAPSTDIPKYAARFGASRIVYVNAAENPLLQEHRDRGELAHMLDIFLMSRTLEFKGMKCEKHDPNYAGLALQMWKVTHNRRSTCGPSSVDSFCCGTMRACRVND